MYMNFITSKMDESQFLQVGNDKYPKMNDDRMMRCIRKKIQETHFSPVIKFILLFFLTVV